MNRRDIVTVIDIADLATTTAAALARGDGHLASWAVGKSAELVRQFGLPPDWYESYHRALIAALDMDAATARAHLDDAYRLEQSGRVGPARGEFLLVPAMLAAGQNRPHDCAVLLAVIRANPVPMSEGHSVAMYRQLRRRTRETLTEDQAVAARNEATQTSADAALARFLSPSNGPTTSRSRDEPTRRPTRTG